MATARNALNKFVAGVSTNADMLSYPNLNADIIDAALAKCNWAAATDPGVGDDSADGYVVGSWWWNKTGHRLWQCESASAGAAVWRQLWPALAADATTTVALAGRAGGQVIYGGTGASEDLNLLSTAHATKGTTWINRDSVSAAASLTYGEKANTIFRVGGVDLAFGQDGTNPPYSFWMQTRQAESIAWTLDINPLGGTVRFGADIYVGGNCSALTFTDRTKGYVGDAVAELNAIRTKLGELDHNTLPTFAKSVDSKGNTGRDIGAMISMLTVAVQQLSARISALEAK